MLLKSPAKVQECPRLKPTLAGSSNFVSGQPMINGVTRRLWP